MNRWDVRLSPRASKALAKLDRPVAKRLRNGLMRLAELEDPTTTCKPLSGPLTGLWRYRVGDYRIICDIHRADLIIIAIDLGHRSTIYL